MVLLILTDIIIALSLSELLAQGKGRESLELLWEFFRSVGCEGPRALPTELVERVRFTHLIVLPLHHIQNITLSCMRWHLAMGVVGADDIQIVIDAHFYCVFIPQEAEETQKERGDYWQMSSPSMSYSFYKRETSYKMDNNMNYRGGYLFYTHVQHTLASMIMRPNYAKTRADLFTQTTHRYTRVEVVCADMF